VSIGVLGNAAEVFPELLRRGVAVDIVTDQTAAHDPLDGYIPAGVTAEEAPAQRASSGSSGNSSSTFRAIARASRSTRWWRAASWPRRW